MQCMRKLVCDSDTGFRREIDEAGNTDGRAARGANLMRRGTTPSSQHALHLLDFIVGSVKQVVRSTFTSETHGVIGTADSAVVLGTMLHEVIQGPLNISEAMRLTHEAGLCYEIEIGTDAKNLLLALGAPRLKPPAEKSFIVHLLWLKEKLELGVITRLTWVDTRDMTSDGHTKGSVPRTLIRQIASGELKRTYPVEELQLCHESAGHVQTAGEAAVAGLTSASSANEDGDGPSSGDASEFEMEELNPFALLGIGDFTQMEVLELEPNELIKIFRKRTPSLHPDKRGGSEIAKREFQRAQSAVDLLKNPSEDFLTNARKRSLVGEYLRIVRTDSAANEKLLPGRFLLQQNLLCCQNKRAQYAASSTASASTATKAEMLRTYNEMKANQKEPFAFTAEDQVSKETRAAATDRMQNEVVAQQVGKKLDRTLKRIGRDKKQCAAQGCAYKGTSENRIKHSARSWRRAAKHNLQLQGENARKRKAAEAITTENVEDPEKETRDAWRKYRRECEEWTPPPDPTYKKSRSKMAKWKTHQKQKLKKFVKRATPQLCDSMTGGSNAVGERTLRSDVGAKAGNQATPKSMRGSRPISEEGYAKAVFPTPTTRREANHRSPAGRHRGQQVHSASSSTIPPWRQSTIPPWRQR